MRGCLWLGRRGRNHRPASGVIVAVICSPCRSRLSARGSRSVTLSPQPRRTAILTATLGQAPDLGKAATALTSAVALLDHYVRSSAREDEAVRANQRARRATHRRSRSVTQRAPTSAARAAAPSPSATGESYGNSYPSSAYTSSYSSPAVAPSATANWYGNSNSSPANSGASSQASSSSQPATSGSAPAASTQTTQPAFGQNGTLGPGRGAPGTQ